MIEKLGIAKDPKHVGYYGGLIESLFALAQFFTVVQWGRLSDRIGRKPVIIVGLFGCAIATVSFGMSQSFTAMIVSRCLAGTLNGNAAVLKAMLGELTTEKNKAKAFALLPMTWAIGGAMGALIGGFASDPAKRYPNLFGQNQFFLKYPYALPCFIAALFPLMGALTSFFFLDEVSGFPLL